MNMPMHTDSPTREGPPRGDKHDGAPGYGPPGSYAPNYPYPYYGPPSYPPPGGYHNYPPPPSHYSGYGPPPPYYPPGGYSYPSQQANKPPMSDTKRRKSPSRRHEKDKKESMNAAVAEDIEMERMRAAAEPVQVKPMRTEYHFFVDDNRDKALAEAEKELGEHGHDKMMLFTNMNARLMKLWEDSSDATRAEYLVKEEEDRRRFMTQDEIASRHCATLTARARSPRGKEGEELSGDDSGEGDGNKRSPGKQIESPPKKVKVEDEEAKEE